jgi:hypothetical protein
MTSDIQDKEEEIHILKLHFRPTALKESKQPSLKFTLTSKMQNDYVSWWEEVSVFLRNAEIHLQNTQLHNSEDHNMNLRQCEKLKFHIVFALFTGIAGRNC